MSTPNAAGTLVHDPVAVARQFLFVREAQSLGQNRGARVEAIQRWSGGSPGDSWCAEFATMVLDIAFQGDAPISRFRACEDIRALAAAQDWITSEPHVGDLFLYVNDAGRAHHVGLVTQLEPLCGIAGNTSADGTSSNGDRVAEHAINARVFVRYPR
jgi:hypothetical protein